MANFMLSKWVNGKQVGLAFSGRLPLIDRKPFTIIHLKMQKAWNWSLGLKNILESLFCMKKLFDQIYAGIQ